MPTTEIQSQIAFKNLLGKSQTNDLARLVSENYGYFFNVPSTNVWSSRIPFNDPSTAITNQVAVSIVADLIKIDDSKSSGKYLAYQAVWGATPSGKDPKTNQDFAYGSGSLKEISIGDEIYDIIPSSYGNNYEVKPYIGAVSPSNEIVPLDTRDWVFQYSSGIFYQSSVTYAGYIEPQKLVGYYYLGNKLSSLDTTGAEIIRVSATGPDTNFVYYATSSTPFISTYSINHLYLVDFAYANTMSVKLNINYLGTSSVYKYGSTGLGELSSGDIQGGTGLTAGPLYYLTWDTSGYFLFFESNPSQTPGLYKNENSTINKVGGIETGTSFLDVNFQEMFNDLLYPERLSNFDTFAVSHPTIATTSRPEYNFVDLGRTLTGVLTFSWNYSNGTDFSSATLSLIDITQVSPATLIWPAGKTANSGFLYYNQLGTFSYTQNVTSTIPDKRIFSLLGSRKNNTYIRKFTEIIWTWRGYYGSSTYSTLPGVGITALSSQLMTQSIGNFVISGTQGYKYLAFPDTTGYNFKSITYFGLPVVLATNSYPNVDSNGNNYYTINVTNSYSVGTSYRVYRTLNQISGTLSVNITN